MAGDKTFALQHVENEGFKTISLLWRQKLTRAETITKIFSDSRTVGHSVDSPADTIRILRQLFLKAP